MKVVDAQVSDLDAGKLAVAHARPAERADQRLAADVDANTHGTEVADVKVDRSGAQPEFGCDQFLPLPFGESQRHRAGGRSG